MKNIKNEYILRKMGVVFIISSFLITSILWLLSKSSLQQISLFPLISLSQIFALIGTVSISLTFLLSSRIKFLESFFAPLDKVYSLHALFGKIGYIFILLHPMLLSLDMFLIGEPTLRFALPIGNPWSYKFGIFSLWTFTILLLLTFIPRIPYNKWKRTHEFMGIGLLFAALHAFTIRSSISAYIPLRVWMMGIISIAILSFIHRRFWYEQFGKKYEYIVQGIKERGAEILEISLSPKDTALQFSPGQFGFFRFPSLEPFSRDLHPFSFASPPSEKSFQVAIKGVGDFTNSLRDLSEGADAVIFGPYGRFGSIDFNHTEEIFCIAGGIGVTPFLSMKERFSEFQDKKIHIFYLARDSRDAVYRSDLEEYENVHSHISVHIVLSSRDGRFSPKKLKGYVESISQAQFLLCGPESLIEDFYDGIQDLGAKRSQIHFEEFRLR